LDFLERSVKTVEALQVMNILCREREDGFIFQIPFLFPGGVKTGDVFVRRNRNPGPDGNIYDVVLFLDLDALGKIVVEAGMRGERIRCNIRCENEELSDFLSSALDELRESVHRAGCTMESVACIAEADLEEKREAFYRERLFPGDAVNLFV
ncbi:MAG TPA: flagellar hook-length control protein FliK, partial [Syntrophales bacterium]|nr:flagellar hook-length control protein FliK [Syntrophales bacterium]